MFDYYKEKLNYKDMPKFLIKYLEVPFLKRLKKVGYFCGMDYASKKVYNFSEYISRYDHSLSVALLVYKLTNNKVMTLAGLFHDIATPCFSHVIDYMNEDFEKQESTELYTEKILKSDKYLNKCLKEDRIDIDSIINFKKYTIVDNERPKVCADRIDGVILTGIGWTKNIDEYDISKIVDDLCIFKNEFNEDEIGFKTQSIAQKVVDVSKTIDIYCHSNYDNYMMMLLAKITKIAIDNKYISYEDLYYYDEDELFKILCNIKELESLLYEFKNIDKNDIPIIDINNIKKRDLKPIVNGVRRVV